MYRYRLGDYFDTCPLPWQNFINSLDFGDNSSHRPIILKELVKYNVNLPEGTELFNNNYIEFETEEDAMAFILRWS